MRIDIGNSMQGNRAMAWILLLFHHLMREDGLTNDQTAYVDASEFDPFEYLQVEIDAALAPEVDQKMLRQGAVIHLLCDLDDRLADLGADCICDSLVQRIIAAARDGRMGAIPEAGGIVQMVASGAAAVEDGGAYAGALREVFLKYVRARFVALANGHEPWNPEFKNCRPPPGTVSARS